MGQQLTPCELNPTKMDPLLRRSVKAQLCAIQFAMLLSEIQAGLLYAIWRSHSWRDEKITPPVSWDVFLVMPVDGHSKEGSL